MTKANSSHDELIILRKIGAATSTWTSDHFQLDLEVMPLINGRTFTDQLRHIEHDYRSVSRKLTAAHWTERSIARLVVDRLTRLTSAVQ